MDIRDVFPHVFPPTKPGRVDNRNPSATKAGPGRKHQDGLKAAKPPKQKGAPFGFALHTNSRKNTQRAVKAQIGARQYRRQVKALRRAAAAV